MNFVVCISSIAPLKDYVVRFMISFGDIKSMLCKKKKITDIVNFKRIRNKTPKCIYCKLYDGECWSIEMSLYCDEINKNLHRYPAYTYVVI